MTEETSDVEVEARALFARFAAGERDALARLYDLFSARLHGYARALVRAEADADEALQEAFLGLSRARATLASVENPVGYLFRSVRNAALALARAGRRAKELEAVPEPLLRAKDGHAAADEADEANVLLARLPDEQREVLVLKLYAGLTFKEIGALLEVPLDTAASRYRYALEKLRHDRREHRDPGERGGGR